MLKDVDAFPPSRGATKYLLVALAMSLSVIWAAMLSAVYMVLHRMGGVSSFYLDLTAAEMVAHYARTDRPPNHGLRS